MKHDLARRAAAGLLLASVLWAAPASALDPGNYTVQCTPTSGAKGDGQSYDISMDKVDLLTLKDSYGAIISGIRVDNGKRVILTGDRGCALVQAESKSRAR